MKPNREMTVLEAIFSLRSVREFKPDPVPKETIHKTLEAASMAASGSNTQPWEFVVLTDPKMKARVREPMLEHWLERIRGTSSGMSQRMKEVYDEATEMLRNTEKAPVLIYCCLDLNRVSKSEEVRYASIYPAAQNIMLAAHALGVGSCLTVHGSTSTRGEPEVKRTLGIPDNVKIACLIYMGYPARRLGRPKRKPVHEHVHYEKW